MGPKRIEPAKRCYLNVLGVRSKHSSDIQIGTENGLGRDTQRDSQSDRRLDSWAAKPRATNLRGSRVYFIPCVSRQLGVWQETFSDSPRPSGRRHAPGGDGKRENLNIATS